jgi:phosphoserine phosphatase
MAPRLVVFDLDGTLLRGPTVCEVLAAPVGRSAEMAEMERLGAIEDLRAARETMFTWYRDRPLDELCRWLDAATLARGGVEGCAQLRAAGCTLAIASFTWRFAVDHFADLLGVEHRLGSSVGADGAWDHVWADTKAEWVAQLMTDLGVEPAEVAAVGDGSFDVPMLRAVGVPVFVGRTLAPGLPTTTNVMPDADLRVVADSLLTTGADRSARRTRAGCTPSGA